MEIPVNLSLSHVALTARAATDGSDSARSLRDRLGRNKTSKLIMYFTFQPCPGVTCTRK